MKIVRPVIVTDAVLTASNVAETDYTAWAGGTTYALADRVRRVAADVHKVFQSAVAGNVGHDPLTDDGTNWTAAGATNRWAMFDAKVQSQTINTSSIAVTLAIPGRADTVALLNVSGVSAEIKLTDATEGVVYDETYSLISDSGITDWYAWFFEPIIRLSDLLVVDLPPFANATLDVTISEPGSQVACGVLLTGQSKDIGGTRYGASLGITDYSVKQADEFGNFVILQRAFARRANFSVIVANALVDQLQNLLAGFRATPTLYIGDEDFTSSAVFGFYKDFAVEISYPDVSICTLELEGLA